MVQKPLPQKVRAGQQLSYPASFFNLQVDVARDYLRDRRGAGAPKVIGAPTRPTASDPFAANTTGGDLAPFAVCSVAGVIQDPGVDVDLFLFDWCLELSAAAEASQVCGVLLEAIADDGVGRIRTSGIVPVQVEVLHASHTHARMKTSAAEMVSGFGGYPIVWKQAGTGSLWALVQLGEYELGNGKVRLDTTMGASGGTASCTWVNASGADAGSVTVANWTGTALDGSTTAITLWVLERAEDHLYHAISQSC